MKDLQKYKDLQKEYEAIDNKANELVKPLNLKRKKKWDIISDWFEGEYKLLEPTLDKLYDRQGEIEDELDILENTLWSCDFCGEYVDHYNKEASEMGFDYGDCCEQHLSRCEHCNSIGEVGANTGPNGIHYCDNCGQEYCDNCELTCDCEEEEEDE